MSVTRINATYSHTLKEISDVMVKPCVMTGSSSVVRPFQTSNSTQRHPARRTCLYISTEELPASWPAATTEAEIQQALNYFSATFVSFPEQEIPFSFCSQTITLGEELECFSQSGLLHLNSLSLHVYLSGMCYVTNWWSSATGGNSYLQIGPASLVGWLHSHHWTDNWRNPEEWWYLHIK